MTVTRPEVVEKLWGREEILVNNGEYCGKFLILAGPEHISSLHYHQIKKETFFIMNGEVELELDGGKRILRPDDTVTIEPGQAHRFRALTVFGATVIEISTPHSDEDVVRLEPSRVLSDSEQMELPF